MPRFSRSSSSRSSRRAACRKVLRDTPRSAMRDSSLPIRAPSFAASTTSRTLALTTSRVEMDGPLGIFVLFLLGLGAAPLDYPTGGYQTSSTSTSICRGARGDAQDTPEGAPTCTAQATTTGSRATLFNPPSGGARSACQPANLIVQC